MAARYRSFEIQILSINDGIQLEIAQVDDKWMLIATDILYPISPRRYAQKAYGLMDEQPDPDTLIRINLQLSSSLLAYRARRQEYRSEPSQ